MARLEWPSRVSRAAVMCTGVGYALCQGILGFSPDSATYCVTLAIYFAKPWFSYPVSGGMLHRVYWKNSVRLYIKGLVSSSTCSCCYSLFKRELAAACRGEDCRQRI